MFRDNQDLFEQIQGLIMSKKRDQGKCIVCIDQSSEYACIPCGHLCLCHGCRNPIGGLCPVCREEYCHCINRQT